MISLCLAALCWAPAQTAKDIPFVVHTADGVLEGRLLELGPEFSFRLDDSKTGALISLSRKGLPLPSSAVKNVLVLVNGDRIVLDPASRPQLKDDRLVFQPASPLEGSASISVSLVSLLWFEGSERDNDPSFTLRRLHSQPRSRDLILLKNGDQLEGTIAFIDANGLRATVNQREADVPFTKLAGVAFNKELQARFRPTGSFAHAVLSNGTRLGLAKLGLKSGAFEGKTLFGADCRVAMDNVVSLQVHGGAATYLSDLTPKSYEHTPFLGVSWPLVKDASVAGRDLIVAGNTYDKGLGMHPRSVVAYDLKGGYRWFEAVVGLDAVTGVRGRSRVAVLVDGKSTEMNELASTDVRSIRINVQGARELTLVTEFSDTFGDVQAHVNWADARLVK